MANFKDIIINVPDLNRVFVSGEVNYSKTSTKTGNIGILKKINTNYLSVIEKWGAIFEIDKEIIIAFIATESAGKNAPPNKYKATGLMQMTPNAIAEVIPKYKSITKFSIPSEAVNFLNKKDSFIMELKRDVALSSKNQISLLTYLKDDSEFNILMGCMYLRFILQRFNGQLNKTMVAYNAGLYGSEINSYGSSPVSSETLATNKNLPLESRSYIVKMLGVDGFLDLIIRQKVI